MKRFAGTFSERKGGRRNPPIAIFANPRPASLKGKVDRRALMGRQVFAIEYQHQEDGKDYRHDFEGGPVVMWALPNGDILLTRKRPEDGPVWEDF